MKVKRSGVTRIVEGLIFSLILFACAYYAFAAIQGDRGLINQIKLRDQLSVMDLELEELQTEVAFLKNKTKRISDHYLDLDLLDEMARNMLGYIRSDELILN